MTSKFGGVYKFHLLLLIHWCPKFRPSKIQTSQMDTPLCEACLSSDWDKVELKGLVLKFRQSLQHKHDFLRLRLQGQPSVYRFFLLLSSYLWFQQKCLYCLNNLCNSSVSDLKFFILFRIWNISCLKLFIP